MYKEIKDYLNATKHIKRKNTVIKVDPKKEYKFIKLPSLSKKDE
uniref:Uncharacterized protein n=1 Tax=viral metagenome TaxID=1070528 RepID=A0A6M3KB57_9ZZZZ